MKCPFCGGALDAARSDDLGEGETGGRCYVREHRCATCSAVLEETRADKIGSADERWSIESPPDPGRIVRPASASAPPCERCGNTAVVIAMPEGHVPAPVYVIGGTTGRFSLRADTICVACGGRSSWWSPRNG